MKTFLVIPLVVALSGCSALTNLIPDRFDSMEYAKVIELNIAANMNSRAGVCVLPDEAYATAKFLEIYSKGTMNQTNQAIYGEVSSLVEELYTRDNPSDVYCKLKWQNIEKATNQAIELSGARIKK